MLCLSGTSIAFAQESVTSAQDLKKLSIEQLMNIEVTSVSRSPEKLSDAASAIQVVTGIDIRRSTSTSLPEALRLAPNLQVARSNSQDWSISSRGFSGAALANSTLANKLLVMIDGRSVYSPLFGGVFWDVQNMLLEDIDRIEGRPDRSDQRTRRNIVGSQCSKWRDQYSAQGSKGNTRLILVRNSRNLPEG